MIPKVETLSLLSGDNTILTVPANKVIEIHEINADNQDTISHAFIARITRSTVTVDFLNSVTVAGGSIAALTSPNKKVIAMDGDVIKINQTGRQDVAAPTGSLHYTEWDVGEVPGIEPKSVIGTITSTGFATVLSTSASGPQRFVIRDWLVQTPAGISPFTIFGQIQTTTISNSVERLIVAINSVGTSTIQRWILEQKGATVMNWQHRRLGIGTVKHILSYIEHSDLT